MKPKIIDCRGLACPQPVINTKKALEDTSNKVITTIVDNQVAMQNVALFARNQGCQVTKEQQDDLFYITISSAGVDAKTPVTDPAKDQPGRQESPATGPVYLISSNQFGQGSPDLGHVLMKSLFVTLAATTPYPAALLFLNTGVFLTCPQSPVLEQLQELQSKGTDILACGTCLDYYKSSDQQILGRISNMFDINNMIIGDHKVITIA